VTTNPLSPDGLLIIILKIASVKGKVFALKKDNCEIEWTVDWSSE